MLVPRSSAFTTTVASVASTRKKSFGIEEKVIIFVVVVVVCFIFFYNILSDYFDYGCLLGGSFGLYLILVIKSEDWEL